MKAGAVETTRSTWGGGSMDNNIATTEAFRGKSQVFEVSFIDLLILQTHTDKRDNSRNGFGVGVKLQFLKDRNTLKIRWRYVEDTLKTCWRHIEDTLKTRWRYVEDTLKILLISARRNQVKPHSRNFAAVTLEWRKIGKWTTLNLCDAI